MIHLREDGRADPFEGRGLSGGERRNSADRPGPGGRSPKLLLLIDEPTEGLAAIVIGEIAGISAMKGRVLHDRGRAEPGHRLPVADRIYVMKEGNISQGDRRRCRYTEQEVHPENLLLSDPPERGCISDGRSLLLVNSERLIPLTMRLIAAGFLAFAYSARHSRSPTS